MSSELVSRLRAIDPVHALEEAGLDDRAWIVGGAVRDAALGVPIADVDFAVDGNPKPWAVALARKLRASPFRLSSEFGTWRVVAHDSSWTADFSSLKEAGIERDLALRDFTINACAVEVGADEVIDPFGGLAHLDLRRLVAVSGDTFEHDPLRLMRAARQAAELGLELDRETLALARSAAPRAAEPAAERIYMELRALVGGRDPIRGIRLIAELGIEPFLLPELDALRGISQGPYHHLDAYEHTVEVLAQVLEIESGAVDEGLGGDLAQRARRLLGGELGDGIARSTGLRFAALLHDIGKAGTQTVMPGGKVGFPGHDRVGQAMARNRMTQLRASRTVIGYVAALTAGHLRLGFMVHRQPLDEHAIHGYLRAAHPWAVDLTLLTVADRLATRGRKAEAAIAAHLELAALLLERAVSWEEEGPPPLPLGGGELADALGLERGPELGSLIERLEAEVYAGEVHDRETLIARAQELLA